MGGDKRKHTQEEIIADMRRVAALCPKFSFADYKSLGRFTPDQARSYLGDQKKPDDQRRWSEAKTAAGLADTIRRQRRVTPIEEIRRRRAIQKEDVTVEPVGGAGFKPAPTESTWADIGE